MTETTPPDPHQTHRDTTPAHSPWVTRRGLLLGAGALAGIYAVDRTDAAVKLEQTVNPFDSEHKLLEPEVYEISTPWLPETVKRWQQPILEMSQKYLIDPNFVSIIMTQESGGAAKAHSPADAKGLLQITPSTAKEIASIRLLQPRTKYDIWDPATNIEFGVAYLAYLRDWISTQDYDRTLFSMPELIAAGYNGGPTGGAKHLMSGRGLTATETVVYSRDTLNMYRERNAAVSPTFDRWKERGGIDLLNKAKAEHN